jgi:hypothetical protein
MGKAPIHPFLTGQATLAPWESLNDDASQPKPVALPRYSRRLSDKILIAFHAACDQRELDVAAQLLKVLEMMFERPRGPGDRRRNIESLVAAHMRIWQLRHPDTTDH